MAAALLAAVAGAILAALAIGAYRWRALTRTIHATIEGERVPVAPKAYGPAELTGLPGPVARFFRTVLEDGQPLVAAAAIEQSGTFNMKEDGENWKPFTSVQRVVTRRPGFDWEARIAVVPGLAVRVHDAYAAGEGRLHATLFGLVALARPDRESELRSRPLRAAP